MHYAHFLDIRRPIEPIFMVRCKNVCDGASGKGYFFNKWKQMAQFTTSSWKKGDFVEIKHLDISIQFKFINKSLVSIYLNGVCFSEEDTFDINKICDLLSKQLGFKLPKLKVGW